MLAKEGTTELAPLKQVNLDRCPSCGTTFDWFGSGAQCLNPQPRPPLHPIVVVLATLVLLAAIYKIKQIVG